MAKFCEYCGTKLEDGMVCNCAEAVAERRPAPPPPPTRQAPPPPPPSVPRQVAPPPPSAPRQAPTPPPPSAPIQAAPVAPPANIPAQVAPPPPKQAPPPPPRQTAPPSPPRQAPPPPMPGYAPPPPPIQQPTQTGNIGGMAAGMLAGAGKTGFNIQRLIIMGLAVIGIIGIFIPWLNFRGLVYNGFEYEGAGWIVLVFLVASAITCVLGERAMTLGKIGIAAAICGALAAALPIAVIVNGRSEYGSVVDDLFGFGIYLCSFIGVAITVMAILGLVPSTKAKFEGSGASAAQGAPIDYSAQAAAAKQVASALGGEAKASFGVFIKSPLEMAATHSFSRMLSLVLLSADALFKVIFIDRLVNSFAVGTIETVVNEVGSRYGGAMIASLFYETKFFAFQHYIFLFLIMAVQTMFFAGLVFTLPKLTKGSVAPISWDTTFGTAAVASIPWTAATLISSLLITLMSYSSFSIYIMFLLCGAAMIISFYLLDAGIKRHIADDKKRMTIIAVGCGIQIMIVMIALFSFIPGRIVNALSPMLY